MWYEAWVRKNGIWCGSTTRLRSLAQMNQWVLDRMSMDDVAYSVESFEQHPEYGMLDCFIISEAM